MPKNNEDIQKGEIIQAVIIADSFDSKFGPLTTTKPRVSFAPLTFHHFLSHLFRFSDLNMILFMYIQERMYIGITDRNY